MQKIDANILLRYVLNDHPELSFNAKEIIDNNIVEVPIEVLCEVIYVLEGHYKTGRQDINAGLKLFFEYTRCVLPHREVILCALEYFERTSLDFVDCILAGYADIEKDEIYTFDVKLQKLILTIKESRQ